jgi:hypothetical protein
VCEKLKGGRGEHGTWKLQTTLLLILDPFFHEPACKILVNDAGHKGLIRHPFLHGPHPQCNEVFFRDPNIHPLGFCHGRIGDRFGLPDLGFQILDGFPFTFFNRAEKVLCR